MKKTNEKSAFYYSPEVVVFAVATEGLLCASPHESYLLYDGNEQFEWEDLL